MTCIKTHRRREAILLIYHNVGLICIFLELARCIPYLNLKNPQQIALVYMIKRPHCHLLQMTILANSTTQSDDNLNVVYGRYSVHSCCCYKIFVQVSTKAVIFSPSSFSSYFKSDWVPEITFPVLWQRMIFISGLMATCRISFPVSWQMGDSVIYTNGWTPE